MIIMYTNKNGKKGIFVKTEKEYTRTLFKPIKGMTASGYYKINKESVTLHNNVKQRLLNIPFGSDSIQFIKSVYDI